MKTMWRVWIGAGLCASALVSEAHAQGIAGKADEPPAGATESHVPFPDPSHVPFIPLSHIDWHGDPARGEQSYTLFGDPRKPGWYGILVKWYPGHFSKPHYHPRARYITVLSGVWWVSSSTTYDPDKTYPLPAGTVAEDVPNTVHWDGAKTVPTVIEIVGEGPAPTIYVDKDGKPISDGGQ